MKKSIQTYTQKLKMPHLFREDLESIEDIIKKELNPNGYKLDLGSFEYQEIKEIPEDTNSTNEFYIHTSSPYIRIDFTKSSARVYAGDDDIKTVGVIKKLTDIILKKERKVLWYFSKIALWLVPILFIGPIQLLLGLEDKQVELNKIWFFTLVVVSVISVVWWIVGYRYSINKFSRIDFAYRKNKPNFFNRNKDRIIVGIFVGVIVAIITQII